ncbi:phospholipid scramblase 1 [Cynoglossus semilaevis]|uniref:phospholipid scramblase 1 n=1 Tax=Cynoglossus semilaevis TaxID=244447 RepID=UPI000D62EFD5|nr:phospholipid scramblase 1-like [Cynoglossus semilaevis]
MTAVTNQPLPLGHLEREKHIQMIFRAFQNRCGPCECQSHTPAAKAQPVVSEWDPDQQFSVLSPEKKIENRVTLPSQKVEEQNQESSTRSDFMTVLETVSQIHIRAQPELQGPQCVPRRIYSITTGGGRSQIFVAVEESSCLCLQCCGPARACTLKGFDCQGSPVFYFERPFRSDACCFGCCLMEMRVYTPQKHLIGTVCQRWSMFTPLLEVCDADGASSVRIQGCCCPCRCFSDQQFQVVSNIGERLGTIWKKWPGFNEEQNMDHEYFGLNVPLNMESHMKLLLLGSTFLLVRKPF